jgi:hypothetical protein
MKIVYTAGKNLMYYELPKLWCELHLPLCSSSGFPTLNIEKSVTT